ncbi:hypothetical protein OZX72_02160 [Bifidobacterium sp. ESL0769]|uniref:hypothetical protein n=1 Tax=Bifidobacterium sp. ESL0769 TaxID=2983229 RepID=UPI0023F680BB|nr:hypothetical protein [Bifidobacterium sp. ESL0769]WEV67819.1 hypothetical protein OZX72_02160 [Bifidobacterium sp. ESL0769]
MMVDGKPVYCIQFGTIVGSAGGWTPLTGSDSGVGATMINQHASDMSDMTQAAVAYAIHDHLNVHDASEEIWTWWKSNGALDGASLPAVASLAAQFWTQASNAVVTNAGGGHNYTQAERTGTVNVGLHDAAGNYTSGVHFTIDMNGPAKFDATGNGHYEGYTNGTEMHIPWTATGNGNVSPQIGYDVTYGMLSTSAGQVLFRDNDPEHQTYNVAPFEVRKDFQPTVTTQVSNKVLKRGQKVMDKVTSGVDQTGQNAGGEWVGTRTA